MKVYYTILVWGFFTALLHMIFTIILYIYFGIGMSPDGAWFLKHILLQPGTFLSHLFSKSGIGFKYSIQLINFIFYFSVSTLIIFLIRNK